jgi:hypothetical protein
MPTIVTSQPPAASVPAGLSNGVYTIPYGNATSFVVSVGGGSTVIVTPTPTTGGGGSNTGDVQSTSTSKQAGNAIGVAGGSFAGAAAALMAALL